MTSNQSPRTDGQLLSGNEAIARGAWEAGAGIGVGYPGTPSTEILQEFVKYDDVYAEWAPNEKVALEVGIGSAYAGARVLATTKHVGLNVAADPLMTAAYTGTNGGLVILVADDPGMHSSQNEQDSHNFASFAGVPMLDPADPAEAYEFTKLAFQLSEEYGQPVLLRITVRVAHTKQMVQVSEERTLPTVLPIDRNPAKWVMMPNFARGARVERDARIDRIQADARKIGVNRRVDGSSGLGIVCTGVVFHYVRDAAPDASIFKLGMTYPLPVDELREFAASVDRIVVAEEADDYLLRALRAAGIPCEPLSTPRRGELSPQIIRRGLGLETVVLDREAVDIVGRPPLLCAACPHRPVFYALNKMGAIVSGDIGCYTLGAIPPLSSMDTCVCMGASIPMAHGMELAERIRTARGIEPTAAPIVSVIGDSTFAHSGITGVINTVYNGGGGTVLILDNRTTAMTGHQGNPVNAITLSGKPTRELELEPLLRACGVEHIRTVDPNVLEDVQAVLAEETARAEYSVIIFRAPCALLPGVRKAPWAIDQAKCTGCRSCLAIGCQAIMLNAEARKCSIEREACAGCGLCAQVCRFGAIAEEGE